MGENAFRAPLVMTGLECLLASLYEGGRHDVEPPCNVLL